MKTRKKFYSAALPLLAGLTACGDSNLAEFNVDQKIPEIYVQGSSVSATLPSSFDPIPLNIKSEESFKSREIALISGIRFEKLSLTIMMVRPTTSIFSPG